MVDDVGDLAVGALQALAQVEQRLLVGEVEREVVELRRARVGNAGRLAERLRRRVGVLEERDRVLRTELEEVVPEAGRADRRDEPRAERAVVEAHGRVHVVGDEREVVDPPPVRRRHFVRRRNVRASSCASSVRLRLRLPSVPFRPVREIPDAPFPGWDPPRYRVDANGKVVGAEPGPHNNWGRFGELDQIGTANHLTPERIAAAAALVKTGKRFSLALPIGPPTPGGYRVRAAAPLPASRPATACSAAAAAAPRTKSPTTTSSWRCRRRPSSTASATSAATRRSTTDTGPGW